MSTLQQQLVCDSSTLTNFKAWAQAISTAFSTFGWTQATDTGQVNWTSIASVPGAGAYVYEVWQPGDALTAFYAKVEYGNVSGTNCPSLRLTLSTTTNGAGTPTGFVVGPATTNSGAFTPPSTTTQYECDFSGDSGRISVLMWRNGGNFCQQLFSIERSLNSSGTYTSSHVTLWTFGMANSSTPHGTQQSLVFGAGVAPSLNNSVAMPTVRCLAVTSSNSGVFNGSIPFDTCAPMVGFWDYPCTSIGVGCAADFAEGVTFTVTLYGSTRTFMPTKNFPLNDLGPTQAQAFALCMRYD